MTQGPAFSMNQCSLIPRLYSTCHIYSQLDYYMITTLRCYGYCIVFRKLTPLNSRRITVLASLPCTRLLYEYKVKMTGKNCQNYTIREEMHGQTFKNWGKNTSSCQILAKTVRKSQQCSLVLQMTFSRPKWF